VVNVGEAYDACERIARSHYENFPVASLLLPAYMRPHIAAIYAFARTADDFADEGTLTPPERLALLDDWGSRLHASVAASAGISPNPEPPAPCPLPPPSPSGPVTGFGAAGLAPALDAGAIFLALGDTIRARSLPVAPFEDLLVAFRQDVTTTRYATWEDVLDYCRRSANPVGRLVLRVAGRVDPRLDRASDAVCTALQLTNFWQDLERDWRKGRLYVPREACERFGARESDLDSRMITPAWREVLADMASRTRRLFDEGRAVCDGLDGRLRYELRLTWLGGRRILDRLDRIGFDVFTSRPALGGADLPGLLWQAAAWSAAPRS
jgi:hydroxysqualene synthase